jgi:pimeloyl-ACP methyl ester carboxylesterase
VLRTRLSVLLLGLLVLAGGCGGGVSDPANARCNNPDPTFGQAKTARDHREIAVHFTCQGAVLAGTLYLPRGNGPHPAVIWIHGSGEEARLGYGNLVAPLVHAGVAVFSYDKRGVGQSEGDCCPGDQNHFNLLAADADGAVLTLRSHPDIDAARVGFYGSSQAGWVVPLADARLPDPVAFTALADAPTVTTGEEAVWSQAAGETEPGPLTPQKRQQAIRQLAEAGPSGFDPAPYIKRMHTPGLWLYGSADKSIPTERSAAILEQLKHQGHDFTIIVYPGAGHGLLDRVPTAPQAPKALVDWIATTAKAL